MGEMEQMPIETNREVDSFDMTKERRLETMGNNIDLMLRRCRRKNRQPREILLDDFRKQKELQDRLGQDLTKDVGASIAVLPDYDLTDQSELSQAKQDIMIFLSSIVDYEFADSARLQAIRKSEEQETANWQYAGILSYEFGEKNELILHLPPMPKMPQLHQLKDSLRLIAEELENKKEITEVVGSSLLLEHPLANKLGLKIDAESDDGNVPIFHMSREDFLERFGK